MKKLFFLLLAGITLASCTKSLDQLEAEPLPFPELENSTEYLSAKHCCGYYHTGPTLRLCLKYNGCGTKK